MFLPTHPIALALNARLQDLLLQASRQALESPSTDAVKSSLNGAGGRRADPNTVELQGLHRVIGQALCDRALKPEQDPLLTSEGQKAGASKTLA